MQAHIHILTHTHTYAHAYIYMHAHIHIVGTHSITETSKPTAKLKEFLLAHLSVNQSSSRLSSFIS